MRVVVVAARRRGAGSEGGPSPSRTNGAPSRRAFEFARSVGDQSLYAALKMFVYHEVAQQVGARRELTDEELKSATRYPLTNQRIRRLVTRDGKKILYSDLMSASPQYLVQRLLSLSSSGVLELSGVTIRRNQAFFWREPLRSLNLCSLACIEYHAGYDPHLVMDLVPLYEFFGRDAFAFDEFTALFRTRLMAAMAHQRGGIKKAEEIVRSPEYRSFLRDRVTELVARGLLEWEAPRYRLSVKGFEAALYADMFFQDIEFSGNVPHCPHCVSAEGYA